jgi:hypothetical protein
MAGQTASATFWPLGLPSPVQASIGRHASWGFFDYRRKGEEFGEGYQSIPTNWRINSVRKRTFFRLIRQITGSM